MDNELINIKGKVRVILTDVNTGEQDISEWKQNLVTTAGKVAILRRMGNIATKTSEGMITYGAVGTATTVPVVADTTLGTELARKAVSVSSIAGSQLTLRVFYTTAEANGALKEFGWFGEEATAAADTGTLFNHVLIDKTKTAAKTLTIEQIFEFA